MMMTDRRTGGRTTCRYVDPEAHYASNVNSQQGAVKFAVIFSACLFHHSREFMHTLHTVTLTNFVYLCRPLFCHHLVGKTLKNVCDCDIA